MLKRSLDLFHDLFMKRMEVQVFHGLMAIQRKVLSHMPSKHILEDNNNFKDTSHGINIQTSSWELMISQLFMMCNQVISWTTSPWLHQFVPLDLEQKACCKYHLPGTYIQWNSEGRSSLLSYPPYRIFSPWSQISFIPIIILALKSGFTTWLYYHYQRSR